MALVREPASLEPLSKSPRQLYDAFVLTVVLPRRTALRLASMPALGCFQLSHLWLSGDPDHGEV